MARSQDTWSVYKNQLYVYTLAMKNWNWKRTILIVPKSMKCLNVKQTICVRSVHCKLQNKKELNEWGDIPCMVLPK